MILQRLPIAGRASCQEVFRQGTPCDCLCFSTSPFPHPQQSSHVLALPGSASSAVSISDPGTQHPERCHPPVSASPDRCFSSAAFTSPSFYSSSHTSLFFLTDPCFCSVSLHHPVMMFLSFYHCLHLLTTMAGGPC